MDTIGTRIGRWRRKAGLTQEDLAVKLGVTPQAVSKWENDISCPDISLLPELVKILGVTFDELLTGKKEDVIMVPESQRKNLDDMTLRILVHSAQGDKVKLNLPMPLVKVTRELGVDIVPNFVNGDMGALKNLDFGKIMELADRGLIGKLVEIESADGDRVEVVVE